MFFQQLSILSARLDPAKAPRPRISGLRAAKVELDARTALSRELTGMPLSARVHDPQAWAKVQQQRRRDLEALLLTRASESVLARVVDLICLICEESSWAAPENAAYPFEDESHPSIDLQAAETAALLGWTAHLLGEALNARSMRIGMRMLSEVRRRVLTPLLAHDDYTFLHSDGRDASAILAASLTALLLIDPDSVRRGTGLKRFLRLLDLPHIAVPDRPMPLTVRLREACARADLAELLHAVSEGVIDLAQDEPDASQLDELLFSHAGESFFIDPAGTGMQPDLSGMDLFRLGRFSGDEALTALGASLHRRRDTEPSTITGRLFSLSLEEEIGNVLVSPPRLKYAALENGRLMTARGAGFFCALHAGGYRANAGDVCLFLEGVPILVDSGRRNPDAARHSLPTQSESEHRTERAVPIPADWDFSGDRSLMALDLTRSYLPEANVHAHQRTLSISRTEQCVRLIDAIDFVQPRGTQFHFITPQMPGQTPGGVILGPALLTWEGDPAVRIDRILPAEGFEDGLYRVTLDYPEPVPRMIATFYIERA